MQRQIDELRGIVQEQQKIVREQQKEIERLKGAAGPAKPAAAPVPVVTPSGESLSFYGFLRLDYIVDSSLTNSSQTPLFVLSPSAATKGSNRNAATSLHPRLTRLGINYTAPSGTAAGWKVSGKFEMDWQNGAGVTVESRPLPRIRHAYLQMQRGADTWLLGQTWDVISPLFPSPNDDTLMWNAGNLGDRRPQIRYAHESKSDSLSWAVALGATGAIDAKDLDDVNADGRPEGNGVRDGEDSGLPNIQARIGWRGGKGSVGLWGHHAWEGLSNSLNGKKRFTSQSVGLDWQGQIADNWEVRGELWTGKNLSDFRGGIGQGINTATASEIDSKGGWLEVGYQKTPRHRAAVGYTLDDPKDGDVPQGGRTRNNAWYLHNRWKLAGNLDLGLNYLYWTTRWKGQATGIDHRINTFIQHTF